MASPQLAPEQARMVSRASASFTSSAHLPRNVSMGLVKGGGDVSRVSSRAPMIAAGSAQWSLPVPRPLTRQPEDSSAFALRSLASDRLAQEGSDPSLQQASAPHDSAARDDDVSAARDDHGSAARDGERGARDEEAACDDYGHDVETTSRELLACSELVQRMGPGFVYLGSSRIQEDHSFFIRSKDLSAQLASMYGSTTWSGIGPGLMEAVCQGAADAQRKAAGFKVVMEATQGPTDSYQHPHLPPEAYLVCRSLLARKQGLLWAGSRARRTHRAGFVALPGGVGTLDELLDLLALRQLNMHGSRYPTPLLVMNYDGCYDALLSSLHAMQGWKLLWPGELDPLWQVCNSNEEAVAATRNFFDMHA